MAVFGASSPIGFAIGPVLGGVIVDRLHWGIPAIFAVSAGLSVGTALLVALGSREVRPEVVPTGRLLRLAFGAVRGVIADVPTRRIFAIFFVAFLANQMTRTYVPVLVSRVNGPVDEASAIGLVTGSAVLIGTFFAPLGGWLGDRVGYRRVLAATLIGSGVAAIGLPFAPTVALLAVVAVVVSALYATVAPMVFALLGTEVPAERRSQTLNLVYLPLYLGGIVGPALGAIVVSFGIAAPFLVGAAIFVVGGLLVAAQAQAGRSRSAGPV
jgi:MFS family permease